MSAGGGRTMGSSRSMVRPPPALMEFDLDEEEKFDVDGRVDAEAPVDGRVDGVVDGRVDAEAPVDGRLDVPVDGRVDAEAPFDGRLDGRCCRTC